MDRPPPLFDHAHGLVHDLPALLRTAADRRRALRWLALGATGSLALPGCGGGGDDTAAGTTGSSTASTSAANTITTDSTTATGGSCGTIPQETAGPYPADGSNTNGSGTVNVLTQSGVVRSVIVGSFGSASGVAAGIPLTVTLTLVNTSGSCAPLSGLAVYLWHCDALGQYSLYSSGITAENYLRGVQVTDSTGSVGFTTIFPGCYSGRYPHIHFEVYPSLVAASNGSNDIRTTQLALPAAACNAVYATSGYTGSAANFAAISLSTDNVFNDGASLQMASASGSSVAGYAASLQVGVAV